MTSARHVRQARASTFWRIVRRYFSEFSPVTSRLSWAAVAGELTAVATFVQSLETYAAMPGAERLDLEDLHPCLHDRTDTTYFDGHYLYQDSWAARRIGTSRVTEHVDVGSRVDFVAFLTALTNVTFIDIRPLTAVMPGLTCKAGSILDLPFPDNSIASLSSLHVAEHVGLGRYGDSLDPSGTRIAARELARVLAPGGVLYFAVPVGRARTVFNAHRIHAPEQICEYFEGLSLIEFSGVDDNCAYHENIDLARLADCAYGCGFFRFTKPVASHLERS